MALKHSCSAVVARVRVSVKPSAGHEVEKGGIVALELKGATGKKTSMTATTSAGVEDVI